ncbi:MAG: DoxX family membrane protein [Streptosporangiales bacterium]|nr:DoxX family membrane protein [Streptosporangiales bacterium]
MRETPFSLPVQWSDDTIPPYGTAPRESNGRGGTVNTHRHASARLGPTERAATGGTDLGLFVLRVVVGLVLAGHGAQKLFGAFGGPGLQNWEQQLSTMGYEPARWFALANAIAEFGGGLLLVLGLLTPLGCAALLGVMINAIPLKAANGFWIPQGFEYETVLAALAVVLAITGPGLISLDRRFTWARGGVASAVVAIVLGVIVGVVAYFLKSG